MNTGKDHSKEEERPLDPTPEEWKQAALEAAGLGSWIAYPAKKGLHADAQCRTLLGLTAPAPPSLSHWLQLVHPSDRDHLSETVRHLLEGRHTTPVAVEFRTAPSEGTPARWLRARGKALFDADGQPLHIAGTLEDITGNKAEMEDRLKLERRFRSIMEHAPLGMAISDLRGCILMVNKTFSHMTGYTMEELSGYQFEKITHPDDLAPNMELVSRLGHGEIPAFELTKRYLRKDGTLLWVTLNTTLVRDEQGGPEVFFSIVRDITRERESQVMAQKLLTLVENGTNLMSVLEADGRNSYINKHGRQMLGFTSEQQVRETPITALHTPEDFAFVQREVLPAINQTGHWEGVMNVRHLATGEVFPVYNHSIRIADPMTGEVLGVGAVMRDLRPELARQEALRQSEQRFRNLIIQAPVAIGLLEGPDLVITTANDAMLDLWGKPRSIIGLPLLKALPEIEWQGFVELLQGVMTSGKPYYGYETRAQLLRKGRQEEVYFNFVYAPRYEGDRITGIIAVASEVTAQVKTKKELQESERRFRNLILEAPVATAVYVGEDMVIDLANEKMIRLWGKDGSVFGKTLREALPELEGQPFHDLLHRVYTTGEPYKADEDPADLVVDGRLQRFYFSFTYKPLHNAEGKVFAILNMAIDVTALVRARQDLQEAQQELSRAIEAAEMGTWNIDLQTGRMLFSERVEEWFGFPPEEATLDNVLATIHEDERERTRQRLQQSMNPGLGGLYRDEYRVVHPRSGRERILRLVGQVFFTEDGAPYSVTGTAQDITAQKMNEQELERQVRQRTEELRKTNQELERSNRELEQFAYVASHDMQEPVRKILTFSQMMQEHGADRLEGRSALYLGKIRASAERMINIIRDILNYSHLGNSEKVFVPTDLNEVLTNVLTDLELMIGQKGAVIRRDTLPVIEAIPLQINQLFYNILNNALKFSRPDTPPVITVTGRLLPAEEVANHPQLTPGLSHVALEITDNGIGFSQQYAKKIFTIFQRLHDRYTYGGTGIGLALCKKVVDNHRGDIFAESEEGKGARFHIILPLQRPTTPQ